MNHLVVVWTILLCCIVSSTPVAATGSEGAYQTIEWTQLIPQEDLDALLAPPEELMRIQDGSARDNLNTLNEFSDNNADNEAVKRFYEALKSTKVVSTFANQSIRIPGFIVPLNFNEAQLVTEFFVVPYFGACLHLPPPPPNQILFAEFPTGVEQEALHHAFWFEGELVIAQSKTELGTSAYRLKLDALYLYED